MTDNPCDRLDDFLDQELGGNDREDFLAHLSACAACRTAVEERDTLDRLLRAAVDQLNPVPPGLAERLERIPRNSQRRRALVVTGLIAASVLLGVFLARSQRRQSSTVSGPEVPGIRIEPEPIVAVRSETPVVKTRFAGRADLVVQPVASSNPNVTIFWVYPGLSRVPEVSFDTNPSVPD